jgi:anti-sigma factor RsiW
MNANDPFEAKLREISWRRKLTPAEEAELRAWLAAHPEARADWEDDGKLTALLSRLPGAPVPTNFTARVLEAVEREEAADTRRRDAKWSWRSFLPKAAVAAVVLTAGLLGYQGHVSKQHARMARSVQTVSGVASVPGPDILADFDAISQLTPPSGYDQDILDLMQP